MRARWTLAVLVTAISCVGEQSTLTAPVSVDSSLRTSVATVTVDPANVNATVGDNGAFTAIAKDSRGRVITGATFTWSSSDTNIVRITPSGAATAVGSGAVEVRAWSGGKTGISNVTVAGLPVAQVVVSPASASGSVGDSAQFTATLYDANSGVLVDRSVTWTSSNPAAVTVSSTGMARAVGPGNATLIASAEGQSGTAVASVSGTAEPTPPPAPAPAVASVTVSPGSASGSVGDSAQFSATARDADGNEMTGRTVTWSSTNAAVVAVSAGGMGRAVGPGSAALVATIDGVTGSSVITVTGAAAPTPPPPTTPAAAVASVTISPATVSVNVLGSAQLSATLRDASGNVLTGRSVTWSSANGLVAGVSQSGTVTGLVAGGTTITASSEGVSGNASVNVTLLPAPAPPTGGSWPNMPSTYSILSDQAFNPLLLPGWELIWNPVGNGTIANNSTAPFSASSVFEVKYPAGYPGGTAPATQVYGVGGKRNLYVGMWWKANAEWEGHWTGVNKLQFLYLANGGGDLCMVAYGPPGGPYELRTALQFVGADSRIWLRPNTATGVVNMGGWHRIEWLVEYNTPGNANGVVKWWIDGQLVGDYRDVTFPSGGLEEYKLSPTWGGVEGTKTRTDYFWFDHVVISGR
jgi:uncharacterized protein YjdB